MNNFHFKSIFSSSKTKIGKIKKQRRSTDTPNSPKIEEKSKYSFYKTLKIALWHFLLSKRTFSKVYGRNMVAWNKREAKWNELEVYRNFQKKIECERIKKKPNFFVKMKKWRLWRDIEIHRQIFFLISFPLICSLMSFLP